jgi:hypothetical protein
LYNYLHGIGFELPLQEWFTFKIPKTTIPKQFIENALQSGIESFIAPTAKVVWIGVQPEISFYTKTKKGRTYENSSLLFYAKSANRTLQFEKNEGKWLVELLQMISIEQSKLYTFQEIEAHYYTKNTTDFEPFWYSKSIFSLFEIGLLIV